MTIEVVSLPPRRKASFKSPERKPRTLKKMPWKKKRAAKRKNKPKTMTWYKKEADRLFSLYIRTKYSDAEGNIKCFTCPTIRPLKKMQNGHFVSRRYLGTRYDERNCRPQCWYCNSHGYGNGRPVEFAEGLKKEYGESIVDELFRQAAPLMPDFDFQAIIAKYSGS
jgi:hypothetical protein